MGFKLNSGVYVGTVGSIVSSLSFPDRVSAIGANYGAPTEVSDSIRHFFKDKVTNHYDGVYVLKQNNGSYLAVADNPGKVPGSHAVYVKEISPNGETTKMYKTTYDNNGHIAHTKDKLKMGGTKKWNM